MAEDEKRIPLVVSLVEVEPMVESFSFFLASQDLEQAQKPPIKVSQGIKPALKVLRLA